MGPIPVAARLRSSLGRGRLHRGMSHEEGGRGRGRRHDPSTSGLQSPERSTSSAAYASWGAGRSATSRRLEQTGTRGHTLSRSSRRACVFLQGDNIGRHAWGARYGQESLRGFNAPTP